MMNANLGLGQLVLIVQRYVITCVDMLSTWNYKYLINVAIAKLQSLIGLTIEHPEQELLITTTIHRCSFNIE